MAWTEPRAERVVELVVGADGTVTIPASALTPGSLIRIVARRAQVHWCDADREFARRVLAERKEHSK